MHLMRFFTTKVWGDKIEERDFCDSQCTGTRRVTNVLVLDILM